jgi:thioredoxin-like negative regulator of GroEL
MFAAAAVASFALCLFFALVLEWPMILVWLGLTPMFAVAASWSAGRRDEIPLSATEPVESTAEARTELRKRVDTIDRKQVRRTAINDPGNVAAQCALADLEVAAEQVDAGFGRLLAVVRGSSGADREHARLHLLSLFAAVGPTDARVVAARRELESRLR